MDKPQSKNRILDVLVFAVLGLLVFQGYRNASDGWFGRSIDPGVYLPLLVLCAFVAVLYPFRIHTRVIWILLAPISVSIAPLIGAHIYTRLYSAAGTEQQFELGRLFYYGMLFFGYCLVWLPPKIAGWSLCRKEEGIQEHKLQLKELFAFTAVVSVMLVLLRYAFDFQSSGFNSRRLFSVFFVLFVLRQCVSYGICIWAGLKYHWALCLLAACVGIGVETYFESLSPRRVVRAGVPQPSFWILAPTHIWNVSVLLVAVAAIRIAGYRIEFGRK